MIKGIVFDFDGLIMDTEDCEYQAYQRMYHEYGHELPLSVWGKAVGTKDGFDPYAYLQELTGKALDRDELKSKREQWFSELVEGMDARAGVRQFLRSAQEMGLEIGLASSSPRSWVMGFLTKLGLQDFFQCICTADDVEKVKPDPSLYLLAVKRLGLDPGEAVAFEDSPNGSLGALRAGLYCVVVPNATTQDMVFPEYDLRISSMADMSLREVLSFLGKNKREVSNQ